MLGGGGSDITVAAARRMRIRTLLLFVLFCFFNADFKAPPQVELQIRFVYTQLDR